MNNSQLPDHAETLKEWTVEYYDLRAVKPYCSPYRVIDFFGVICLILGLACLNGSKIIVQ